MEQPQEVIEDEEHERAWDRVAAIDVAKASGVVCTRVPDENRPGRRRARVWTVTATMSEVTALGDHLRGQGIEVVTIESTSDLIERGMLQPSFIPDYDIRRLREFTPTPTTSPATSRT